MGYTKGTEYSGMLVVPHEEICVWDVGCDEGVQLCTRYVRGMKRMRVTCVRTMGVTCALCEKEVCAM